MPLLTVSDISKKRGNDFLLDGISFTQDAFRKTAIAGESGSGKTTLLRTIAGLVQPDHGAVLLKEEKIKGPDEKLIPGHPSIAYLSQHYELRNSYRVAEILEYANLLPEPEAQNLFDICRIAHLLQRRTDQLSGGEKQRIALARLLIASPMLLLLDEPYSNLDMIHKNMLKAVIKEVSEKLRITCLMVSHSPQDTLSWADEIIVMKEGRVLQKGTPFRVYRQPVNEYVAGLFGRYNLMGEAHAEVFSVHSGQWEKDKKLLLRPEDFKIEKQQNTGAPGVVKEVLYFGGFDELTVQVAGGLSIATRSQTGSYHEGDMVSLSVSAASTWYV